MHRFLVVCLLFISFISFGQAKRAQSLMEKQKYESAFDLLSNGLAKDTTSASIPFVLAKLYLVEEWPQHQLDSAFYFSVCSLHKYDLLDEKHLDRHIKDGFGKTRLLRLKKHIDSLVFEVVKQRGKETDYQKFIDRHTDASELDSAIYLRNEQAYLTASTINTLESYKRFLNKYLKAADWDKANANYQKILYTESTLNGRLQAYKAFVEAHPSSPYLGNAIDHIYDIEVGRNTISAILGFVMEYPNSAASFKAIGLLYHKHLAQTEANSFADKYPKISISDSLLQVIKIQKKTMLPVWSGSYYQLIDLEQKVIIDSLVSVDNTTIDRDFLAVETLSELALVSKSGDPFYESNSFSFEGEEQGFIFLKEKGRTIIINKNTRMPNGSGGVVDGGEEANLVEPFISYKANGFWGLKSITGLNVLGATYDSIWAENSLIFLSLKEKVSIIIPSLLYPALDKQSVDVTSPFTDYEWLTDRLLWVEKNEKEGLFTASLEVLVPLSKHQIDLAGKGWSVSKKGSIIVPEFSSQSLTYYIENEGWQIGHIKDSVIVKYNYKQVFAPTSASLLGSSAIIMHKADSAYVYLTDSIKFFKPLNHVVKPLLSQANEVCYYEVIEGKSKTLINSSGQKLDLNEYDKVIPLSSSFFQLERSNSIQLYSSSGQLLLDDIDGSSLINDSTISILKDQQFGIIQPRDSVLIEPRFAKKLVPISDSLWVVSSSKSSGLISSKGNQLVPLEFDDISVWTNGILFLKKDLKWHIYDIKNTQFVESGIVSYSSITRNGSPKITFQKGVGIGVFDSERGVVLKPTFTNIVLKGTTAEPYYRAEKYVEEAGLHIMLYYDMEGEQLFQNILDEVAYGALYGISEE
ncbi:MAG: WG repeat-containing protein [Cyclobacteriaceae bacterium]|nr:WG repeat-containing protein [Cyclobacteriaceae bacterium]